MKYDAVMEHFKGAPTCLIPLGDIQTHDGLQPRVARLVPIKDKGRAEESSEQHITTLRLVLDATEDRPLDPVWLAEIGNAEPVEAGLYLVDGHHRLKAYQQAKRQQVPARVLALSWQTALVLSKLVNCTGRSLALHNEQRRDAAWQYLAALTHRGAIELPAGESLRSVAARFGISKNTVSSMLTNLPHVIAAEFHALAIDPGTGWPRWRHVREAKNPWQTSLPSSDQQQLDRDAERVARHIVKLVDGSSPAVRARALEMLANDEVSATDQLASVELLAPFSPARRPVPIGTPAVPAQPAHLDN
ncbi:DNA-binding protein [Xanthomonas translucens pv. poae]|uniref:DNA-binding protein n=1 Tax=Xanthomonas graminis pv. poae TaxID=227946 RepID=A0A0K3A1A7_9XANT|nr:ParB/RepB/Spo0J family partition protein [Xanthomonas translucens]UKE63560.1 ParB/RepB/Spo0J family partition protein [Xanthomonas translucens pv. poae]CTP91708.1 DNA-binding protein [Xanthomonas translucens pv. poae]